MARRGKFARLVDDFVTTVEQAGGVIDRTVVEQELRARIDAVATQLRVTAATVLRSYIPEDWGREAGAAAIGDVRRHGDPSGPAEDLAVRVAGRLLAALGQALIYAAVNGDQQQPEPLIDLRDAGEAVSGLGLAIRTAADPAGYVTVGADVAACPRSTLQVFRDQLRAGTWTFCPCGEDHGQTATDAGVLAALSTDLLFLAPAPATATAIPVLRPGSQS
ncbi:hypothetical protein [Paractinoplanes rishiriensis]|uniref:Uncharacterized protein n=1 Tax=Paractinoplanes rishiriensis TaxID=1050105 RepID=A0A919K7J2_9ACTN|nr:hypothetical protein [Actinoplanes rishiriensis]GIF01100.1 hypothetical protein Ari01nite_85640 [Actinoplanes rishiriensis]